MVKEMRAGGKESRPRSASPPRWLAGKTRHGRWRAPPQQLGLRQPRRTTVKFAPLALAAALATPAQAAFPPGYIDPAPVLARATAAIGADKIRCLKAEGTVTGGRVGQERYVRAEGDWPLDKLENFSRYMNWQAGSMREDFDRPPGLTPASYKYGAGWLSGTPTQKEVRQSFSVNPTHAWSRDGVNGAPQPIDADVAEQWRLDLLMNPVGFLKAAALPGADPIAVWRWELGESGRDGPTVLPQKVSVVSIKALDGQYRIDATINQNNLIQRLHSRFAHPVLGDMNFEHEFTDEAYADLGDGMRFPTGWHSHQGLDDNFNVHTIAAGHNAFGGVLNKITVNQCDDAVPTPAGLPAPADYATIETTRLAEGVYLIGGAPMNSVAIGFEKFVAVVEAPINETRSLAVIEEVARLFPEKPIRYLINTHQHFDTIGGIRTYAHIGATIITHAQNRDFYIRDVMNYTPRTIKPDLVALMPPTELTEGYTYEFVKENYVVTDGKRLLYINYAQPFRPAEGMLMATLPAEGIVVQSDLVSTHEGVRPGDGAALLKRLVGALGYSVRTVVPITGKPVSWEGFLAGSGG